MILMIVNTNHNFHSMLEPQQQEYGKSLAMITLLPYYSLQSVKTNIASTELKTDLDRVVASQKVGAVMFVLFPV